MSAQIVNSDAKPSESPKTPPAAGNAETKPRKRGPKPPKPYPEFPLYAHSAGVWAKSIRGRDVYFGPWSDPDGALERYLKQRDYLHAGILPPVSDGLTLDELVNRFLAAQRQKLATGEIGRWQYGDYLRYGKLLLDALGRPREADKLRPLDFAKLRMEILSGRSPNTAAGIIIRIRTIFKWGLASKLLTAPPEFGPEFKLPPARARRRALRGDGPKDLSAEEIRALLVAAGRLPNLRTMILLGINCGLGNSDCAELRTKHLDLDAGLLTFPRPKTEAERRASLWPETVIALRASLEHRQKIKDAPAAFADVVFLTRRKLPYVHFNVKGHVNTISLEFARLLRECKLHRKGVGFYSLRRTFRTIADETKDWPAIDLVMGHLPDDSGAAPFAAAMGSRYRQRIGDDRLRAVAEHVRTWFFGNGQQEADHAG